MCPTALYMEVLTGGVLQANGLAPNWGQTIFQTANEIAANTLFQTKLEEIESKKEAEKEWWEKRRSAISSEFLKELDAEDGAKSSQPRAPQSEDGSLVDGGSPADASGSSKKKKGKK